VAQTQRRIVRGRRQRPVISAQDPRALALCDFCGFLVNHDTLQRDMQYRGGSAPVWTGFLVCGKCRDVPQPYYQKQVLPPDPVPVVNPRPDDSGQTPWDQSNTPWIWLTENWEAWDSL
jgi:hypothetical protein